MTLKKFINILLTMKKNRFIYIPLILSFVLSGCNQETKKDTPIVNAINDLKGNLTVTGNYNQTAYYEENEIASSSELLTFKFLNDEKKSRYNSISSENEIVKENIYLMGENGYTYTPLLNYKNEVFLNQMYDENENPINFLINYGNPFELLTQDLLTQGESINEYVLNLTFANQIYAYFTETNNYVEEAILEIENNNFVSLNFKVASYEGYYDYEGQNVRVKVDEELLLNFKDYKNTSFTINESTNENKELHDAFIDLGNNYTLKMTRHTSTSEDYVSYFYFTGEEAYLQYREGDESMKYDKWFKLDKSNPNDKNYYEYKFNKDSQSWTGKSDGSEESSITTNYEDFLPKFNEISSNLFVKNGSKYEAMNKAVGSIAQAICPKDYQGYTNFEDNASDKVEITLLNGDLNKIVMHTQYEQFHTVFEYEYTFEILNIGETKLPSFVK